MFVLVKTVIYLRCVCLQLQFSQVKQRHDSDSISAEGAEQRKFFPGTENREMVLAHARKLLPFKKIKNLFKYISIKRIYHLILRYNIMHSLSVVCFLINFSFQILYVFTEVFLFFFLMFPLWLSHYKKPPWLSLFIL